MPTPRRRPEAKPRRRAEPARHPPREFTISAGMLKWAITAVTSLFLAYGAWKIVWDDIKTYWRQESIQSAKDKETDAKLKGLAIKAEVGRAWLFWSVGDMKAQQQKQWAAACPALQQPADVCEQWKSDARQYAEDAASAKRDAQKIGKDGE